MFRSDTDDTTPDEIVIDGWIYTPSTITSVTEDRKTFDHLSQQMVGKLAEVTGCNDMVEARYNFILFCTKVVDTSQDELRQLREHFGNISEEPSTPESYNLGQGYLKHYAGRPEFDLNKIFSSERWRHQEDQEEEERDTEKEHPRSAAAAAASTSSSSPSPRCPIDYVTSPIRHPKSAAAAPPSTSSSDDEDPTLLQSAQDLLGPP